MLLAAQDMEVTVTHSSYVCADVIKPLDRMNVQHRHWPNWIDAGNGLTVSLGPWAPLAGVLDLCKNTSKIFQ